MGVEEELDCLCSFGKRETETETERQKECFGCCNVCFYTLEELLSLHMFTLLIYTLEGELAFVCF